MSDSAARAIYVEAQLECFRSDPTLSHFSFRTCSPKKFRSFVETVSSNDTVTELDCRGSPYAEAEVQSYVNFRSFSRALAQNQSLQHLRLRHFVADHAGAIELAKALETHPKLESLHIGDCRLGATGFAVFAQKLPCSSLSRLSLWQGQISASELSALEEGLIGNKSLTALEFESCKVDGRALGQLVERLPADSPLKHLELYECKVTPGGFVELFGSLSGCSLTSLDLCGTCVPEAAAAVLPEMLRKTPSLAKLDLGRVSFRPRDWLALVAACREGNLMENLYIQGPSPQPAVCEDLLRIASLRCLHLHQEGSPQPGLDESSFGKLPSWLASNPLLSCLSISVSTGGAAVKTFLDSLKENTNLSSLGLILYTSQPCLVIGTVTKWLDGNVHVQDLTVGFSLLGRNLFVPEAMLQLQLLAAACGRSRLHCLCIDRSDRRPLLFGNECLRELAQALKTNTCLTNLSLRQHQLTDRGLGYLVEALRSNSSLKSLDLRWNNFRGQCAGELHEALRSNVSVISLTAESGTTADMFPRRWADSAQAMIRRNVYPSTVLQLADETPESGQAKRRRLTCKQASNARTLVFRRLSGAAVTLHVNPACRLRELHIKLEEELKPVGRLKVVLPCGELLHHQKSDLTYRDLMDAGKMERKALVLYRRAD